MLNKNGRQACLLRKNRTGLPLALLITGLALSSLSCAMMMPMPGVETEMSKKLKDAAMDLIFARRGGILIDDFKTSMERKFPGMEWGFSVNGSLCPFKYQGRAYQIMLYLEGGFGAGERRYTNVGFCRDIT